MKKILLTTILIGFLFGISYGADTTKPKVTYFSACPTYFSLGQSTTIKYTVQDSGGSGLNRVELWRKKNGEDWKEIKRTYLSGSGPVTGSFTDQPSSKTTYEYGIHVVDVSGNWDTEGGASPYPIKVTVGSMPTCFNYCGKDRCITGYCAPQCVGYARKLSGICDSDCYRDSAYDWYTCESNKGHTSSTPDTGRVLILEKESWNNYYGHAMYVKSCTYSGSGDKYYLILSHSNYNGTCCIETSIKANYYKNTKKLNITTGAWAGKERNVRGFIKY